MPAHKHFERSVFLYIEIEMIKIRAIPDIPPKLIDAVKKEDLVIFFGAGVSQIIGCPSWREFSKAYLNKLLEYRLVNYFEYEQLLKKDPRMALTICQKMLEESGKLPPNPAELLQGIPEKIKEHRLYEALYKFNAIFVTTNFDNHMDDVVKKNRPRPVVAAAAAVAEGEKVLADETLTPQDIFYAEEELLITALSNGSLIHLHGSIEDPENLVITLPDYIAKYKEGTNHHDLLESIFNKKTVLFMGYGLEEYDIIEFLIKKSEVVSGEIKHYMLQGAFKEEGNMMELYSKYYGTLGIELIPYSKTKKGYDQLVSVIKAWAKKIGPYSARKPFIEKRKLLDEVD